MKSRGGGTQYIPGAPDLEVVLALVRGRTLAAAGARIGVDASTVFRAIRRIERGLGERLFERSRTGYHATETAHAIAEQAERIEAALEAARSATQAAPRAASGTVRITTTDTVLHALVAPALKTLREAHPLLEFELRTGNELANLTRRDADIALRATRRPPPHLIGKEIGAIRVALYAARKGGPRRFADVEAGKAAWVAPDDALPEHPSVVWRKSRFPKATPAYRVDSILSVLELVALGAGVGILPLFLAETRRDLVRLSGVIDDCETQLWLLAHPDSRHLRRISAVYGHLAQALSLP